MKTKQFILTLLASGFTAGFSQAALVSYFTFDDSLNNAVAGQSAGTLTGTESYVSGKFGKAIALKAVGNYVNLNSITLGAIGTGDFTISLWVNLNNQTVLGDPAFFSNKDWADGKNRGINYAVKVDGKLDINTYGKERVDWDLGEGPGPETTLAAGWNNLILIRSGTNLSYYFNGNLVSTETITAGADFKAKNWNFLLGDHGNKGYNNASRKWSGTMLFDNLSVYDTALTAAEVRQLQTSATLSEPSFSALLGFGGLVLTLQDEN